MDRLKQLQEWSIYEYNNLFFIEPDFRHDIIMEKINDVIDSYKPKVVVKAGLGSGRVILELINNEDISLVVVETSLRIIEEFIRANNSNPKIKDIRFINGNFTEFPIDYYAADLIISIDNLDFQETAPVIDEFKRALQFDAYLFWGGIVLHDDDIEGVYDDFMRMILPLHNDYYLKDDLKTFMNIKSLNFIKGNVESFDYNIDEIKKHISDLYGDDNFDDAEKYITDNQEAFIELYNLSERNMTVPYFTGLFIRKKV
ncbi:MAG: class I SAM-dependent methyltransferase [Leptospirales bacterium]|nr:class I SAM-dependent methyltransferase [Leptospirales bacterium]